MLSLEQCRKIDPTLRDIPDAELSAALEALYGVGNLAFDLWAASRDGDSKFPLGVQSERGPWGNVAGEPWPKP